ncbi:B12-binding domain-containing radical SAM protein [Streptomyces sp. URMC 123]|uniref:B12-binding domain-containing radical SAM protein n=1 Tax=Streptomyces sp. URMC 123 TaxID=3423403 RepID=UPI003F1A2D22
MSRICLVVPTHRCDRHVVRLPLDALAAAGRLRAEGHAVTVWDHRLQDRPGTGPYTRPHTGPPWDLMVFFSTVTDSAHGHPLDLAPVRAAVDRGRTLCPTARTVVVGPHGTLLPDDTLRELPVDHVAIGESESAAVGAVHDLLAGTAAPVLPAAPPRPPLPLADGARVPYPDIPQVDFAPPAYDLVPLGAYTGEVVRGGMPQAGPCGMVLAARGCADGCSFCRTSFGTRARARPLRRVLAEVDAQRAGGLDFICFLDSGFGADAAYYRALCRRLRCRDIGWTGRTRPRTVLAGNVIEWARAGCRGMRLGAVPPTEFRGPGHWSPAGGEIHDAVLKLRDAGITPVVSLLLGLPGDDACADGRLVDWAAELPAWFGVEQVFLRPGTALHDRIAARIGGGTGPATWQMVHEVNRRYRASHPVDLDAVERRLAMLPNHVGNAMTPVG